MTWNVKKFISPPFQCTSITNRVLSLFDRFTAYYNCMTWNYLRHLSAQVTNRNVRKLHLVHNSANFSAQVSQIVSENSYLLHFPSIIDRFTSYLTAIFYVFSSLFDRLTAYYNCITWNVRKFISPPFQCTSITNGVLSLFDRFTAYYNYMSWNGRKLISPPFQCTSITNRVLSLFDHFTTFYNCMSGNLRKLVTPRF